MPIATPQGTLDFKSVDKVTFVGASSNTVIDTTTGSLGVGVDVNGPTSNLHVVGHTRLEGDIDMLHTANTASIKLNSNVVTEFPRSKKLIKYPRVALGTNGSASSGTGGGYTLSGYTVKASDEYNTTTYTVSKVFTNTNFSYADTWISAINTYTSSTGLPVINLAALAKFGQNGSWIEVGLPNAIQLYSVHISGRHTHFTERIDTADVWASNTGNDGDWVKLTTIDFNDTYTDVIPMVAEIDTQTYYRYFAIQITKLEWSGHYASIGQWKLFGVPEYDPEAHGTDVVVKSVPNVPNTDWLEVYYDAKDLTSISGTIADLSGKSVVGTLNGDVSLDTSNNVKSFSFDGSGDYISGTLTNTGDFDFTVSTWVFETNDTTTNTVWMIGSGSSSNNPNPSVALAIDSNGSLDFFVFSGIEIRMSNFRDTFGINKWHHIVCTRIGTNLKFFINGVDQGKPVNNSDTLSIAANSVFNIGARTGNQLGNNPMHGRIANFRLFNRALTSDEIYQLYAYQKEYFGHGDLSMTLKAGRLGIGTSEPRSLLQVGDEPFGPGSRPMFRAVNNSTSTLSYDHSDGAKIFTTEFDTAQINITNSYSTSTGRFTAPISGYYFFEFQLLAAIAVGHWGTIQLSFYKNGVNVNQATQSRGLTYLWVNNPNISNPAYAYLNTPSCRAILYLNRGEYVQAGYPGISSSTASSSFEYSKNYAFFQGYLLST